MSVCNVRKKDLQARGLQDFEEWNAMENTVYIGRNMSFYVKGTTQSKWSNPFSVKKFGRDKCLKLYEDYLRNNDKLINSLEELRGKELGCWCSPEKCHGDILLQLLDELNQSESI